MKILNEFLTQSQVDTIKYYNNQFYTGGYEYINNTRKGILTLYDKEFKHVKSVNTSGTFDLLIHTNHVYVANSSDISKYTLDLHLITHKETDSMNTFISTHGDNLFVSTEKGYVKIYNLDLEEVGKINVGSDIIWTNLVTESICKKSIFKEPICKGINAESKNSVSLEIRNSFPNDVLFCGGEEPFLVIFDFGKALVLKVPFMEGITSLLVYNEYVIVGSYDEHIYFVDRHDYSITRKLYIGGGIWRMIHYNSHIYMSCMYEGIKVIDKDMKEVDSYNFKSLVYGICVVEENAYVSLFYDKVIYKINKEHFIKSGSVKL